MINKRKIAGVTLAGILAVLFLTASSCETEQSQNSDKLMEKRNDKLAAVVLCGEKGESQECRNLAEKKKRDEDPNRITYVYTMSWTGEFIGYYVVKGKVSSNQSQMGPMDQAVDIDPLGSNRQWELVEAPGDDGSFGPNEDGIFFFTADGTKITWNGLYQQSDRPLKIKAPLLYE